MMTKGGTGLLVVLSSPSGGGKTTVIKRLLAEESNYLYSVSMTTRPPRENETDGRDYFFIDEKTFADKIDRNELIEYEKVHGYLYGTPKAPLERAIAEGQVVLLDMDVHGALTLQKHYPNHSLLVFLEPPDMNRLIERLKGRGSEGSEQIARRLQRVPEEMVLAENFDRVIVNEDLAATLRRVRSIIKDHIQDS